ncbi:hypothetical protein PYW07_001610 [Mythimna separata]|uniref:Peptidase S1 domain-containing protein n=1 Tax=Mythimna separata TaxID=271217 RepID=A0AAD8DWY4_MYTSE|nr:hypothetical protein PYW07_001610 [Mythimna separata]
MNNFVFLFVISLCGTPISSLSVERTNRISGGSPATDTQFGYMISLQERSQLSTYTRGHRCGGALVTLRHAVTSASCVHEIKNKQYVVINATEYRVFAGAVDLTNDTSTDRHRDIKKITVHPDYRPNTPYVNDIAIITLASEFPSNAVSTVALAVTDPISIQGGICQSSGWGSQNETSSASTQLMHIRKAMFEQTICREIYSEGMGETIQINIINTMLCAINFQASSCEGDLGNPLVCNSNLNGILIYHRSGCSDEPSAIPDIYTRISSFRPWIQETTTPSGASSFQPGIALGLICIIQIVTAKVLQ